MTTIFVDKVILLYLADVLEHDYSCVGTIVTCLQLNNTLDVKIYFTVAQFPGIQTSNRENELPSNDAQLIFVAA